jgi:hypothetical protein
MEKRQRYQDEEAEDCQERKNRNLRKIQHSFSARRRCQGQIFSVSRSPVLARVMVIKMIAVKE